MQNASKAYKDSMKRIGRNRGYIRVNIGVINSEAQRNVNADDVRNQFTYFSDASKPFHGYKVDKIYATCEEDFSKLDGTMYFVPKEDSGLEFYNNGIVTESLLGAVYIGFGGVTGLDIKGLMIDFGESYPTDFTIENDGITRSYTGNDKRYFTTEDVFDDTSYFIITPTAMINGQGRLRIYQFSCGIVNTFTNNEVMSYSSKEYVSSIAETIPSNDVALTVDNQSMYYSPDNIESALAYMEVGQEVKTEFGYDVTGNGDIEWLPPTTTYLKTWAADDVQAKFTSTDRFDYLTGTYYKGLYRVNGISLYDLAIDVLEDAGITDSREYFIDPYLKNILVYNPMPKVKHSEALQIIANAGRCVLFEDRQSRIHMQSSFIPDMTASVNNETEYSHGANILNDEPKDAYALASRDFSVVGDNAMYFMPKDANYLNTGYISGYIADSEGLFEENPIITIDLEAGTTIYGLLIRFRNVAPQEFIIRTFYEDVESGVVTIKNPDLEYVTNEQFGLFDRMELEFTKGHPNSRITVDNIVMGDFTDYTFQRNDLISSPVAVRQEKIKTISIAKSIYKLSTEEAKELKSEEIVISAENNTYTVYFSNASYGLTASVEDNTSVSVSILESSSYYAKLQFSGVSEPTAIKYVVTGHEYTVQTDNLTVIHNENGEEIEWNNPLISESTHAVDLEQWLASYYLGDVDYQIKWRGDPRTDANDLFYLELKNRENAMIRTYQNDLTFSGAWSGSMKARKVVL